MARYLLTYRSLRRPGVILCHAVPRHLPVQPVHRIDMSLSEQDPGLVETVR